MKMLNLFQEFFFMENKDRLDEYIFCMNKNLNNPLIEKLYLVIYENEFNLKKEYFQYVFDERLQNTHKLVVVLNDKERFMFNYFLSLTNQLLPPESLAIVANLDIFIPESENWKNIYEEFFSVTDKNICLALARTEFINEETSFVDEYSWNSGAFCDAWGFITPLKLEQDDFPYEIPVGFAPTCDAHMFIILQKKYEYVFNWAEKYKIYHYDIVRKPDIMQNKTGRMILPENVYRLPGSEYIFGNHNGQENFLTRNENLRCITPYKNWEQILNDIKINKTL